jgi:hypothetical protein
MRRAFPLVALVLLLAAGAARGAGTNVLQNPDFDDDAALWSFAAADGGAGSGGPDAEDADACVHSGSLTGTSTPAATYLAVATQCAPVFVGVASFRMRAKLVSSSGVVQGYLSWETFSSNDCSGSAIGGGISTFVPLSDVSWSAVQSANTVLGGSEHSVRFKLVGYSAAGSFVALFDRAFLGDAREIFADDFEVQATCRW